MPRSDPFNRDAYHKAQARALRRRQLWHAARMACPDYQTFWASAGAIERAVSRLLAEEFGGRRYRYLGGASWQHRRSPKADSSAEPPARFFSPPVPGSLITTPKNGIVP